MSQAVLADVIEKTNALIQAATCSEEARQAARRWLDAVGTDAQAEETKRFIAELEADIMPLDTLIGFARSEKGQAYFGAQAAGIAAHAQELKDAGATYCDCPACAAAAAILEHKAELLA